MTALLSAAMLGLGIAVGAAIGPAPSSSFAGSSLLPSLLPSLLGSTSSHATQPASGAAQARTPARRRRRRHAATLAAAGAAASAPAVATEAPSSPPASEPVETGAGTAPKPESTAPARTAPAAPVSSVWLIELGGEGFAAAESAPAGAPYMDTQAIRAGALLGGWSALDGSAFASAAALAGSSQPQVLDTIVQPACPEGALGATCAAGTPGQLAAADAFLQQTLPPIMATPAYREHGLIVVTFAAVVGAQSAGLPAGAASTSLGSRPPTGVLLISPFASAGSRPATAFDPTSPQRAVRALLRR